MLRLPHSVISVVLKLWKKKKITTKRWFERFLVGPLSTAERNQREDFQKLCTRSLAGGGGGVGKSTTKQTTAKNLSLFSPHQKITSFRTSGGILPAGGLARHISNNQKQTTSVSERSVIISFCLEAFCLEACLTPASVAL